MQQGDRASMFRLRYDTFKVRLGWDVETTDEGHEIDCFDRLPEAQYIIAKGPSEIDGCWRLLPTLGPNMLADVFPELLQGLPAPRAASKRERASP